jgi:hypothetical protein
MIKKFINICMMISMVVNGVMMVGDMITSLSPVPMLKHAMIICLCMMLYFGTEDRTRV